MKSTLGRALIAGAAGTLALELTTYLDLVIRGRSPSDVPERVVGRLASKTGVDAIDEDNADESAQNRRTGASALLGYATGLGTATVVATVLSPRRSVPLPIVAILTGGAAMAISDVGASALGVTDPKEWGVSGWLADAIPHAVFGFTTAIVMNALKPQSPSSSFRELAETAAQHVRETVSNMQAAVA